MEFQTATYGSATLAAERNLIGPLGDWAIMTACQDAAHWPGSVRVTVNVSPSQTGNMGFAATVTQALTIGIAPRRHAGLRPSCSPWRPCSRAAAIPAPIRHPRHRTGKAPGPSRGPTSALRQH